MESALLAKAFVLGVVEGLTEFLPISSTGHLILVGDLIGFADEKAKVFEIVIQTGAMLAIVWEYRERFGRVLAGLATDRTAQRFALNLLVAFTPAAVLGLAFSKVIKTYLFHAVPVALAFIVGAFIILWVERRRRAPVIHSVDEMTWKDALKVGVAQAFALIPGTSRSGATIIGGMLFGLSRRAATEFSFFLAVPTLVAAGAYDFWKNRALFDSGDVGMFAVGSIAAFVSAFLCVRWLLRYIATHDFTPFAWYRIAFGAAVLATAYAGVVNWSAL
ncbi:MAG: undecaprenyl-diphosphate phosphatase [Betaproteobacteria bacterium]|nr:MAG: undecaprenyl-diphosphate phosphatase [Betaproteobacteria bacterium]